MDNNHVPSVLTEWMNKIENDMNNIYDQAMTGRRVGEFEIITEETKREIDRVYTGLNSKGEMKEWKMIAWGPVIEDSELD